MNIFFGVSAPSLTLVVLGGCIAQASALSIANPASKERLDWPPRANEFMEKRNPFEAMEEWLHSKMTSMEAVKKQVFGKKVNTSKEILRKVAVGENNASQPAGYGTLVAVARVPRGLAMCLPQSSSMPWLRLLLRMHGHEPWNDMHDRVVSQSVAENLIVINEDIEEFLRRHGRQYVKSVVVRDPVTRLLFGYLETCRGQGQWSECLSRSGRPVTFTDMVDDLAKVGAGSAPDILRQQVDACGMRTQGFDVLGWHEDVEFTVQALLSEVGLWSKYGQKGWGEQGEAKFSDIFPSDNTHDKVCDFYSPRLLRIVRRLYSDDFDHLGYDISTWNERCADQWAASTDQDTEANAHVLPTPGEHKFPFYHHATKCAPTYEELHGMAKGRPNFAHNKIKFYIHEDGDFNFSEVLNCFLDQYGINTSADDWDNHVHANISEHLGEVWLLKALQAHPQRTLVRSTAQVHIIGALPFVSYMAGQESSNGKTCGSVEDHEQRMGRVAESLRKLAGFRHSNGRNFFIFTTHFRLPELYTEPLLSVLNEGNVMVGTADMDYTHWKMYPNIRRKIILPYKAHYMVENAAFVGDNRRPRNIDFMFRGKIGRSNEGSSRQAMWGLVNMSSLRLDIEDVKFVNEPPKFSDNLAAKYSRSRYCLAPAGDSPTSRRLFDALAGGCVPLALGDFDKLFRNLPFTRTIDWSKIVMYAGSLPCIDSDIESAKAWLEVITLRGNMEGSMRRAGVAAFQGALSYARNGTGLVSALLTEVAHEMGIRNQRTLPNLQHKVPVLKRVGVKSR